MKATKPRHRLSFRDRLSRLTFAQACKLLGPQGTRLLRHPPEREIDPHQHVYLAGDLLRVTFPAPGDTDEFSRDGAERTAAVATLTLTGTARDRLHYNCTACRKPCRHVGALLAYVLDNKSPLGLAKPPQENVPVESLGEDELVRQALADRAERAKTEPMKIRTTDAARPWSDYAVTSTVSGKTYRVALRGLEPGVSYCSCPDFRTNTLGTCKHILKVQSQVKRKFTAAQLGRKPTRRRVAVHLRYDGGISLRLETPTQTTPAVDAICGPLRDKPIEDVLDLLARLKKLAAAGQEYHVYPDAEEYIQERLHEHRIHATIAEIRRDPAKHPLRTSLLKAPLLPYQLDGIAFAVGAGRAVLADDMGLGKTIQGVGVAELLAREIGIRKVLVICPASLKSQWRSEIRRFCDQDVQLIAGRTAERGQQYGSDCFFTICNYEQVLKDILPIEQTPWDLIILDEGQRIKNWEAKTTRIVKGLKSRFALVLSGTPLENRLDDLYSVVQFIDDRRLGPGFRFFNRHRVLDEKGKVLGYKNLDDLRERLRPILLRRTRESVQLQLPERTDELVRIAPTDEQLQLHQTHMQTVSKIVRKKFITEMDLLRLRMALMMCRMSADSTFLVTKEAPAYSSKLERLAELFDDLADEPSRKVVLFSEWTTMLDLIEPLLTKRKLPFVRLDGNVPQNKRPPLVHEFQTNPACRFFLTTNAGSTGLNLQAANTVINVDLPWNPAVLEQRIARAHRLGQTQPVQVYILVTEQTIEESLLKTLDAKRDLALAALDAESDVDAVALVSGTEELRRRLEMLLGARGEAPLDASRLRHETSVIAAHHDAEPEGLPATNEPSSSTTTFSREMSAGTTPFGTTAADSGEHRERVAAAGGELLGAVFKFLGELVQSAPHESPLESAPDPLVATVKNRLADCIETDPAGRPRLTITLPDRSTLVTLAQTLAKLLVKQ